MKCVNERKIFAAVFFIFCLGCSSNENKISPKNIPEIASFINEQFMDLPAMLKPANYSPGCIEGTFNFENTCSGVGIYLNTKTFSGCKKTSEGFEITGFIEYLYSQDTCEIIDLTEASLVQEVDLTIRGRSDGDIKIFSELKNNYRGSPVGGGLLLQVQNQTTNFFQFNIIGLNKTVTDIENKKTVDLSARTGLSIGVQGFQQDGLYANNGSIEIMDGLEKITYDFFVEDVIYSSSCRCPVQGHLKGNIIDGGKGTVTLEYLSCANISVNYSGNTQTVLTFPECYL